MSDNRNGKRVSLETEKISTCVISDPGILIHFINFSTAGIKHLSSQELTQIQVT